MRFVLCHEPDEAGGCSRRVQDAVHGAAFALMPIDKVARIAT